MTSSGTYNFSPSAADTISMAYARVGVRRTALTQEHMTDALMESNFLLSEFSNLQPLLWRSELISQALTQGTATYTLPGRVVMILICYIETGSGTSVQDRVLGPLSTVEYDSIPNKTNQAPSTSFWLNRQITPTITFWPVPDGNGPYTAYMQCVTQVQDVAMTNGTTLDLPYRFLDAFVAGLSARLARLHAPDRYMEARAEADRTWQIAATQDVENTPFFITPGISSYYR